MDDRMIERASVAPEDGWHRVAGGFLPDINDLVSRLRDAGVTAWDAHERGLSIKVFINVDAHGLSAARAVWLAIPAVCDLVGDEEYQDISDFSPHSIARISRIPSTL